MDEFRPVSKPNVSQVTYFAFAVFGGVPGAFVVAVLVGRLVPVAGMFVFGTGRFVRVITMLLEVVPG